MGTLETILAICGSLGGVLIVLFGLFGDVVKLKIRRKYQVEDRRTDQSTTNEKLDKKIDEFISAQKKENAEIRQHLAGMEKTIHTVSKNTKALVYSDICRDALNFIKQGNIAPELRARLKDRWIEYRETYEDDSLNNIMAEVDMLRIRQNG